MAKITTELNKEQEIIFKPLPGPQTRFLKLTCYEALYGGAAGGGKSVALVMDAIRLVGKGYGSNYRAFLFRRTFKELEISLLAEAYRYYPKLGAKYTARDHCWEFPTGELIYFAHCEHESDMHIYQGAEIQYLGLDESTHFSAAQIDYLNGRVRSSKGVPLRVRYATNPGGESHDYFFERYRAWLDTREEYDGPRYVSGQIVYTEVDFDGNETFYLEGGNKRLGRTFISSKVSDNHYLNQTSYVQNLNRISDPVKRQQLRDGDWTCLPAECAYFNRKNFQWMKMLPNGPCRRIRYWDRASTALLTDGSGKRQNDPDWTVGVRLAVYGNPPAKGQPDSRKWIIEDVVRLRGAPSEVQNQIWRTAHADGTSTIIYLEMDPGSAGKFEIDHYKRVLRGFAVRSVRPTGDKETRAAPASSASAGGAFAILGQEHSKPTWYKPFFDTLESFPKGKHDDDVDALSGAFNASFNINVSRGTVSNYRGI